MQHRRIVDAYARPRDPYAVGDEDWARPLLRPVYVRHGRAVRTLADLRAQILAMAPERRELPTWRIITQTLMTTVLNNADVTPVTLALEMVLRNEERLAFAAPSEAA